VSAPINGGQMARLQTLYGQLCAHTQQPKDRAARIAWAAELVRRPLASFRDLTRSEARGLIDTLQKQLGVQHPAQNRPDRHRAERAGTEGRRGDRGSVTLVGASDLARIQDALDRLGWSQAQLDGWLRSPSSPLGHRASIRTLGDANRVYWALKNMAKARGLREETPA
jgi:hypothetical protein